jgi:hypothetical protein
MPAGSCLPLRCVYRQAPRYFEGPSGHAARRPGLGSRRRQLEKSHAGRRSPAAALRRARNARQVVFTAGLSGGAWIPVTATGLRGSAQRQWRASLSLGHVTAYDEHIQACPE